MGDAVPVLREAPGPHSKEVKKLLRTCVWFDWICATGIEDRSRRGEAASVGTAGMGFCTWWAVMFGNLLGREVDLESLVIFIWYLYISFWKAEI